MQTISGRIRVRVVPLGGVYTIAPARTTGEAHPSHVETSTSRVARQDGRILRLIERKRTTNNM